MLTICYLHCLCASFVQTLYSRETFNKGKGFVPYVFSILDFSEKICIFTKIKIFCERVHMWKGRGGKAIPTTRGQKVLYLLIAFSRGRSLLVVTDEKKIICCISGVGRG